MSLPVAGLGEPGYNNSQMTFACPHLDVDRDACERLKTDCVPGRPGCVLAGSVFAVPVEQRLRERAEENRRREWLAALQGGRADESSQRVNGSPANHTNERE